MIIRECREDDLALLEHHNPSPGQTRRHKARFQHQQQGLSTFLTARTDCSFPCSLSVNKSITVS